MCASCSWSWATSGASNQCSISIFYFFIFCTKNLRFMTNISLFLISFHLWKFYAFFSFFFLLWCCLCSFSDTEKNYVKTTFVFLLLVDVCVCDCFCSAMREKQKLWKTNFHWLWCFNESTNNNENEAELATVLPTMSILHLTVSHTVTPIATESQRLLIFQLVDNDESLCFRLIIILHLFALACLSFTT